MRQLSEPAVWPSSALDPGPGSGTAGAAGATGAGSLDGAMEAGRFFRDGAVFFAGGLALLLPLVFVVLLASVLALDFFIGAAGVAGVGVLLAP